MSNYKLAIIEPYLPLKHGILNKTHQYLYGHYLVLDTINLNEFYKKIDDLNSDTEYINKMYNDNLNKLEYEMNNDNLHPIIRNYRNIIRESNQFTIQIVKPVTISVGNNDWDKYSIAINKTHWIRLIQRKWREIRKKRLQSMKNLTNMKYRELHGNWPMECNIKFKLGLM
jgi:hypothetical protein